MVEPGIRPCVLQYEMHSWTLFKELELPVGHRGFEHQTLIWPTCKNRSCLSVPKSWQAGQASRPSLIARVISTGSVRCRLHSKSAQRSDVCVLSSWGRVRLAQLCARMHACAHTALTCPSHGRGSADRAVVVSGESLEDPSHHLGYVVVDEPSLAGTKYESKDQQAWPCFSGATAAEPSLISRPVLPGAGRLGGVEAATLRGFCMLSDSLEGPAGREVVPRWTPAETNQ